MGLLHCVRNWNADSDWWHWSYLNDWTVTMIAGALCGLVLKTTRPFCRDFNPRDPTISHPYSDAETFPNWTVPLIGLLAPVVCGALGTFAVRHCRKGVNARQHLHALVLTVAQAVMLSTLFVTIAKQYAGRLRPDFISRLKAEMEGGFDPSAYDGDATREALMKAVCANDNPVIVDGRRSFPSGHSSFSFAGWTVVVLYLLHVLEPHHPTYGSFNMFVALAPSLFPAWIALSRTDDYRHGFADVLSGSLVGIAFACVVFRRYFASGAKGPVNRKLACKAHAASEGAPTTGVSDIESTGRSRRLSLSGRSPLNKPRSPAGYKSPKDFKESSFAESMATQSLLPKDETPDAFQNAV